MNEILNPYIAGAPVVETSMFFGREDIFGWIERSLTGKFVNHILVLHGQRRVGKTSVLKQIPRHLSPSYIQIFFDLQGRTNTTLDRFLWWMASEISRTLKRECNLDLPKIERNAFADPEAFINDFLPFLRKQLSEKVLLLTFDEFDTLDRADIQDSLARPLIAYLRRLMEVEGLNFIFSIGSSGNKLENMQASYTDFFKSALYRKVSFLTKDDCSRLITKPVEGTITYEPAAIEKISYFTSGHPYFTQLMCHELFSRCQKTGERTITASDVADILGDVIERGTVNLKFVWDEASDLEKWLLAAMAQEEGASLKRVHQMLKGQGLRSSDSDLNSAILHLRDKDVLDVDNGFVIQLMKLWLQTNRPMDRVREELVQINPIADRYLEIGDEYRERGENQQAIQSYEQALAVQENNIRALQNIATIHSTQNSFEEAVKYFARILLIDEENIPAKQGFIQVQMSLAKKAIKEGDEVEAEKAIRSILMIAPSHAEATKLFSEMYVQKAETLFQNGLEEQALEEFQTALRISPDDQVIRKRYEKIIADKKATQVKVWLDKAEKSLARQRWDEAASMVEEALNIDPENIALQQRLLEIKDAPRQEKIKAYKHEAEQAITKGNYPKAISAIQTAMLLAPEDSSLKAWLDSIQGDQANAQLRMYQSQADQGEASGNWEAAIAAREAALKLDPQNERLAKALHKTKDAKQKQEINSIRVKIDQAKQDQNWEAALAAGEKYLQLSPDDQELKIELETLRIEQRKSKLENLKNQAIGASKAEKWEDAIQHWQTYLAEKPEDGGRIEKLIDQAKQKAALLRDYETAQAHIRKRQYNRAIHLLQGIIAKDPTYKASSRLLVEAVEANKQKKPIWKSPWLFATTGFLLVAVLVIVLLPKIRTWVNPSEEPSGITEIDSTPIISASPTPEGKIITVNNANDSGTASFRYALLNAQKYDTIVFNPNIFPPDYPNTIFLASQLPRISQGNITLDASNAGVILDGSNLSNDFGLIISSDRNKIMGLQIINFPGIGIYVEGGSFNQIGGPRNLGVGPFGEGNLISNNGTGIQLLSSARGNSITGNIIGTDSSQTKPFGNSVAGILIEDNGEYHGVRNIIGPDNVIAYNGYNFHDPNLSGGIVIFTGKMANIITGNSIYDNNRKGINFPQNDIELTPPAIIYHEIESGVVSGQTCPNCSVEIFSTDRDEGKIYEGTTQADEFGNFLINNKGSSFSGPFLTATTTSGSNTSEISYPVTENSAIQAAVDAIQNPPTYETDFEVWEFGEPNENVSIENGKLITPSDNNTIGQLLSNQASVKLAVQFEFEILDSGLDGACKFLLDNDEMTNNLGFGFTASGISYTETNVLDNNIHLAEDFYDYYDDQPNEVLIIVVEDRASVFANNQLIYSFLDREGSSVYNQQFLVADAFNTCGFDNYKIWNLEGLEYDRQEDPLIRSILTYLEKTPATMENDFTDIDPDWLIDTKNEWITSESFIDDGSLVVNNSNSNLNENDITFPRDPFTAKNCAISFVVDPSEFSVPAYFGLRSRWLDPYPQLIQIYFDPQENKMQINPGNADLSLFPINMDRSGPQHMMIITYNQYLAVLVDGKTISLSYTGEGQAGDISHFFIERKSSEMEIEGDYQLIFDDIHYWNLDGVEFDEYIEPSIAGGTSFYDSINSYISENPPTFEDDFSTVKSEWGDIQKNDLTFPLSDDIVDGKLNLSIPNGTANYTWPINGIVDAEEIIVSFKFDFIQKLWTPESILFGFKFLQSNISDSEYDLRFIADGTWEIVANNIGGNQYSILDSGTYSTTGTQEVLLSVVDKNNILLMINDQPVSLIEGIANKYNSNYFYFSAIDGKAEINFDDFKFWNLDGVEIQP